MNFTCRKLDSGDIAYLVQLVKLYEDVFEMKNFSMPGESHLQTLLDDDKIIFFVAMLDNEVVGGLTAYILPSVYATLAEVYIYDVAVETKHQRKGVGRQLINSLKGFCKELPVKEIYVPVNIEDKHAIDFYHSTGGIAEHVIHFSYRLDE